MPTHQIENIYLFHTENSLDAFDSTYINILHLPNSRFAIIVKSGPGEVQWRCGKNYFSSRNEKGWKKCLKIDKGGETLIGN